MSDQARLPSYRHHKQSGQAIVTLPDGFGGRRDVLLGTYGTVASKREYDRRIKEWIGNGRRLQPAGGGDLLVNELALAYWNAAKVYHCWEKGKGSYQNVKDAIQILKRL